jgi:hypothetical protein
VELEHATFGELQELITTASNIHPVDRELASVLDALHTVLDRVRAGIPDEEDPDTHLLSDAEISDLIDPLEKLQHLQGKLEAHL